MAFTAKGSGTAFDGLKIFQSSRDVRQRHTHSHRAGHGCERIFNVVKSGAAKGEFQLSRRRPHLNLPGALRPNWLLTNNVRSLLRARAITISMRGGHCKSQFWTICSNAVPQRRKLVVLRKNSNTRTGQ